LYTTHMGKRENGVTIAKEEPSTLKIWASILTGKILEDPFYSLGVQQEGLRYRLRMLCHSLGLRWRRENWTLFPKKKIFNSVTPNYELTTVADEYNSVMWNIPTICPEFIYQFPDEDTLLSTRKREYKVWKLLAQSLAVSEEYDLGIIYFHLLDILGHYKQPLLKEYKEVVTLARVLSEICDVMIVSDHGTSPKTGHHTDLAYFGSTRPITATSVLDVADEIRNVMTLNNVSMEPEQLIRYAMDRKASWDEYSEARYAMDRKAFEV